MTQLTAEREAELDQAAVNAVGDLFTHLLERLTPRVRTVLTAEANQLMSRLAARLDKLSALELSLQDKKETEHAAPKA